ncbi:PTS maltose transporter subunit IIBC [Clostridium polyendosporum]|uniref:PTS maltose transporter subunit IIBC n=1 Tax=Clostridium polyendosporum TaxID=69208 RepID=A0A919VIC3_9CLOT|nr:PTS system trehalose-specific EIIBC component [Clostridium polyendosporum]GIM30601.1 PTS maltose transporter subunit IIBC [Clostridium polyendosporum]
MAKFVNEAKELLEYAGGKENIASVNHCATRMRFVLNDVNNADIEKIKAMKIVKGTFVQAGQFQVIVGNEVSIFYNDFAEAAGIDGVSKEQTKVVTKDNRNFIQRLLANLAEIFAPLIPAIIVGGLILGFRNIIGDIKLIEGGTKTLTEVLQFWSGVYSLLWLIGESIFFFLPVGITWSISKKMGTTQILGIILGITLVSPQLLNAYAFAGTPVDKISVWNFGFAKVQMIGYQAQVIPSILAGFFLAILEKNVRKIVPEYISMIVVPLLSLVPAVLIAHAILGPIGWVIGKGISTVIYSGLTSSFGWLFAALFGFAYAPLVITGLHHMTNVIDLELMARLGGTNLWPMISLSNIAQGSAVVAMIFINRRNEQEKQVSIQAAISCYLGVIEPAMFGINLKYIYPFIAAVTGSAIAAVISINSGVMANSIGVGGLPGILSIKPQFMLAYAFAVLVAIVVPFVLTTILSKANLQLIKSYKKAKA